MSSDSSSKYVVGIDLGGTKVEACLMDSNRKVLKRSRRYSEPELGLDRVIRNIVQTVAEVMENKKIVAIGIGTPGTYIPNNDALYGIPHTPIYETAGFIGQVRTQFHVPVIIENDANCLALAEYYHSCYLQYKYVMGVILGTGMGFGLILEGKLYRGAIGSAGEIGHTTVKFDGRVCECGRKGCAEAYLSGRSISRRYADASGVDLDVKEIYQRYLNGEENALRLFEESYVIMANVFADAVNAFDLEAIILGGGVSNLPIWYERVPKLMNSFLFGPPRKEIPIIQAELGDSAGVVGAGYLALREIGAMEF